MNRMCLVPYGVYMMPGSVDGDDGQTTGWWGKGPGRLPGKEDYAKTWGLVVVRQRVFQAGTGLCHVLEVRGGTMRQSGSLWL